MSKTVRERAEFITGHYISDGTSDMNTSAIEIGIMGQLNEHAAETRRKAAEALREAVELHDVRMAKYGIEQLGDDDE